MAQEEVTTKMTLKHAKLHEQELSRLAAEVLVEDKYKYFNVGYMALPDIDKDEWNNIQFVSYTDKVIGYIAASAGRTHNIVTNIQVWSAASTYHEYKVFERDLLDFFIYLLKRFDLIEWTVVTENPVKKKYRKFVKTVGGGIVGTIHSRYRIHRRRMDAEMYELLPLDEVIEKVKQLRDRIRV